MQAADAKNDDKPCIIAGKYEVGRLLRRGATGVVHYGRWLQRDGAWVDAVLKIEACAAPKKQMQREVAVYRRLEASRASAPMPPGIGVARCAYDTGAFAGAVERQGAPAGDADAVHDVNVLCMERLGPNLADVVAARGPLSDDAARGVARRLVVALRELHERTGHAHRDVKPQNVCVAAAPALPRDDCELFLVDFGLAHGFRGDDGAHVDLADRQPAASRRVHGSVKYLSVHAHRAIEAHGDAKLASRSRRCDLEAVAYVALHCRRGALPWSRLPSKPTAEYPYPDVDIHRAKTRLPPDELCADCPRVGKFLAATRRLGFAEAPDYDALLDLLGPEAPGGWREWASAPTLATLEVAHASLESQLSESLAKLRRDLDAAARRTSTPAPTPRRDYRADAAAPRSSLKKKRSLSDASSAPSEKKLRFAEALAECWEVEGLGYARAVGAGPAEAAGFAGKKAAEAEEMDAVVARWRGKLLKSPPASPRPKGDGAAPRQAAAAGDAPKESTVAATLARLLPHLRSEKRFGRAAGVLAKLLRKASFEPAGRTAADKARDAAAKLGDAGALRDALAVALNGGRSEVLHKKELRAHYVDLFDAVLEKLPRFPHQLVGELALWSAVGPYNVLLGDAARPDLRNLTCAAGDVPAVARRMNAILEALAAHPKRRRAAEDRRVDAPAALELADAPFASRAFDVLMALADAHREARDDAILRGLKTARTALAPHLNPLQRRKLDTTHSTMKATRGLVSDGC